MWQILEIESSTSNFKFRIKENDQPISHKRFLDLLNDSDSFREFYTEVLAKCNFEAFFWENKPVTKSNLKESYECNLVSSDFLAGVSPDTQTFASYFKTEEQVVSFPNLGGDAQLVAPCPRQADSTYTHIGNFLKSAPGTQIMAFWERVAGEMHENIGKKPRWLSTSGLGVFWLHARIDSFPKYYQTQQYKTL